MEIIRKANSVISFLTVVCWLLIASSEMMFSTYPYLQPNPLLENSQNFYFQRTIFLMSKKRATSVTYLKISLVVLPEASQIKFLPNWRHSKARPPHSKTPSGGQSSLCISSSGGADQQASLSLRPATHLGTLSFPNISSLYPQFWSRTLKKNQKIIPTYLPFYKQGILPWNFQSLQMSPP